MVIKKPSIASLKDPKAIPRCAHVIPKPEIISKAVLNRGNSITGITTIPTGGHCAPKRIEGQNEEWKNAQKKPKNNITSDTINNKKPYRNPVRTTNE